jgi:riboflavin kinase/FMN adenylyltransferase
VAEHVFTSIADLPAASSVVTIGAFDGVHRGHQHVLRLARERADARGARLLVVTFDPLPAQVFAPDRFPGRIITTQRRRALLFEHGADAIVELPFSTELAKVTAEEFMEQLAAIGPVHELWIGSDFALGHRRLGTASRLVEIGEPLGIEVHAVPRLDLDGMELSSTAIRRLIAEGRADEAANILGHRFQVEGIVQKGDQVGRSIGFPTANVPPPAELVALPDGIYASLAWTPTDGGIHPAMTYIGTRPALNTGQRVIETHLFDFDGNLYGKPLVTEFVQYLRPDAHFASVEQVIAQLEQDERTARAVLERHGSTPVPSGDFR